MKKKFFCLRPSAREGPPFAFGMGLRVRLSVLGLPSVATPPSGVELFSGLCGVQVLGERSELYPLGKGLGASTSNVRTVTNIDLADLREAKRKASCKRSLKCIFRWLNAKLSFDLKRKEPPLLSWGAVLTRREAQAYTSVSEHEMTLIQTVVSDEPLQDEPSTIRK